MNLQSFVTGRGHMTRNTQFLSTTSGLHWSCQSNRKYAEELPGESGTFKCGFVLLTLVPTKTLGICHTYCLREAIRLCVLLLGTEIQNMGILCRMNYKVEECVMWLISSQLLSSNYPYVDFEQYFKLKLISNSVVCLMQILVLWCILKRSELIFFRKHIP